MKRRQGVSLVLIGLGLSAVSLGGCGSQGGDGKNLSERKIGSTTEAQDNDPDPTGGDNPNSLSPGDYCQVNGGGPIGTYNDFQCCSVTDDPNGGGTADDGTPIMGATIIKCTSCIDFSCTAPSNIARTSDLTLANPGNQSSKVGAGVRVSEAIAGGTSPFSWSETGLPSGVSIDPSSGVLSGAATSAGTSTVTIDLVDSSSPPHVATTSFTWTVTAPAPTPTLCTPGEDRACCAFGKGCSCFGDQFCNSSGSAWGRCTGSTVAGKACQ
jgi:hypothetical protein